MDLIIGYRNFDLFFLSNISIFDVNAFYIINLSQPDKLLGALNLLPILIFITNYIDSSYRYYEIKSGQKKYLAISFFICVLIYNMPSCMTLYWLTSSIFSLFIISSLGRKSY
jgi:membrane protein insertase Oxa1/YidC/SpoIIIJ